MSGSVVVFLVGSTAKGGGFDGLVSIERSFLSYLDARTVRCWHVTKLCRTLHDDDERKKRRKERKARV